MIELISESVLVRIFNKCCPSFVPTFGSGKHSPPTTPNPFLGVRYSSHRGYTATGQRRFYLTFVPFFIVLGGFEFGCVGVGWRDSGISSSGQVIKPLGATVGRNRIFVKSRLILLRKIMILSRDTITLNSRLMWKMKWVQLVPHSSQPLSVE